MSNNSFKKWIKSPKNKYLVASIVAVCIPLIVLLFSVAKYGVNVPYLDQWEIVTDLEKIDNGTLGVGDLWRQHNEHRIFFPRIVLLLLAKLTNWYTPAEVVTSLTFSVVTFIVLFKLLQKTVTKKKYLLLVASFLMSAWYFSPIQWENWLWGWQVEWFMCIAGVVFSIYFLYLFSQNNRKNRYFTLAVFSSLLSTFSLGGGILIWVIGLLLLIFMQGITKNYKIIWAGLTGAAALAYFIGYVKPKNHPALSTALEQPLNYIKYFFTALGGPFSANAHVAIFAGILLFTAAIVLAIYSKEVYLTKRNLLLTWASMTFYGMAALATTAVSRLGFGVSSATSSRYTAFSVLAVVGIIGVTTLILNERVKGAELPKATAALVALSMPLLIFSYTVGLKGMANFSLTLKALKVCTYEETPKKECVLTTYPPSEEVIRYRIKYIREHDYWFR